MPFSVIIIKVLLNAYFPAQIYVRNLRNETRACEELSKDRMEVVCLEWESTDGKVQPATCPRCFIQTEKSW